MENENKIFYRMGHDYILSEDWCWLVAKKDKFQVVLNQVWCGESVLSKLNEDIEMHMEKKEGSSLQCDYIGTWHDVHIISNKFKKILEKEKLELFEFIPIQIFDKKGIEVPSSFYVANLQTFKNAVINTDQTKDIIIDTKKLRLGTRIFATKEDPQNWFVRRDFAIEIKREQGCTRIGFFYETGGVDGGKIINK